MYLEYIEYQAMGGTLEQPAFDLYARMAEYAINAQAAGKTGRRISKLDEIPQAVKDCVFDLISFMSNHNTDDGKMVASESQSSGGISESVSYTVLTKEQIEAETESIIYNCFFGGGIGGLLYRGVTADDV